jgi:hypothetical protein
MSKATRVTVMTGVPSGRDRRRRSPCVGMRARTSSVNEASWCPASSMRAYTPPGPVSCTERKPARSARIGLGDAPCGRLQAWPTEEQADPVASCRQSAVPIADPPADAQRSRPASSERTHLPRWACVLARSAILRRGYSSEHVFEHLGHAVVAGCGCEVVGGGNRVWMTA